MQFKKNLILKLFIGVVLSFSSSCKTYKVQNEKKSVLQEHFKNDLKVENKGIAGNTSRDLMKRLDSEVLNNRPDLVILMVGTNDMLNSKKFISFKDYEVNLIRIVKKFKNNNIQVLLMSPPPVDSIYLFMRHDETLFTKGPNEKLQKTKRIVENIAKQNNALFIDINAAFRNKGLPIHNQDAFIINEKNSNKKDGVHLTSLGYRFIAENIYQYLNKNNLLLTYRNIICFGDSITKGSGAAGAGTMTGENYPSFLYTMLSNKTKE